MKLHQTQLVGKRSRLDPEPVPRRDFLGLAAVWTAITAAVVALIGALRLPRAAVLPTPSKKFAVELPESLAPGQPYQPPGRALVLFRDAEGVYAISTVCTHLGCLVRPEGDGFHCPCHGSQFALDGSVLKGPAPSPLPWLQVSAGPGGTVIVDEGTAVPIGRKEQV